MAELNWMQRYAATEIVESGIDAGLSRREMLARLVAVCGSVGVASTFLAACSGDSSSRSSSRSVSTTTRTPTAPSPSIATSQTPPTSGGSGHRLSVAADDPDVRAANVTFPGPAPRMFGYVARPSASGPRPGVLVVHEIFGLTDHIRDVVRRLAKVGYLALAVDLVSRDGGTDKSTNIAGALTQGPVEARVADLNSGVAYLEGQDDYSGKLGVVGFCFGGGMTLSFAAAQPKVRAAVPYYGPTPQPPSVMRATKAAILAHYGADDARVDAGIPDLAAALTGKQFEKRIYAGAGHAFNNDTRPSYDEAAAVKAWTATVGWFARYLR